MKAVPHRYSEHSLVALSIFITILFPSRVFTQTPTIGLLLNDAGAYPGYTLFAPLQYPSVYLIDNEGQLINEWKSSTPSVSTYLLDNANLLRMVRGGSAGLVHGIEILDWDGTLLWSYQTPKEYELHHDMRMLPNGNIIAIAWETKTHEEAVAAGRVDSTIPQGGLKPDVILEIKPIGQDSGEIVWRWHFWDHLSCDRPGNWIANGKPVHGDVRNPGKFDVNRIINLTDPDWIHCNGIDYNVARDEIAISSLFSSEFYVISHATADYSDPEKGIEEAKGSRGDILYRWGNPEMYGLGNEHDQKLFGLHDIQWISTDHPGADNFLVFNNGRLRNYSTVEEIIPPLDANGNYAFEEGKPFDPESPTWMYIADPPNRFYASFVSGAQRLANGNTLITDGVDGHIIETTPDRTIVWRYKNPVNAQGPQQQGTTISQNLLFKARRYPLNHPGFTGRDLTPKGPIESYQTTVHNVNPTVDGFELYPNPATTSLTIRLSERSNLSNKIIITDFLGRVLRTIELDTSPVPSITIDVRDLTAGQYICRIISGKESPAQMLSVRR